MMKRVPFSQVLKNVDIDIQREYERLYYLFCKQKQYDSNGKIITLREVCSIGFSHIPFRETCISLEDFDNSYGFHFEEKKDVDMDYLIAFCEYSYNLAIYNQDFDISIMDAELSMRFYLQHVIKVVDKIGYMPNYKDGITDFVPKDQAVISVAEIIDTSLSYKVLEYNHHSMRGDLERKREILLALANKMEPERSKLNQINQTMANDLFFLLNNLNIRHSNTDIFMDDIELEQWYDETYQLFLLSFLELDNVERKERVKILKEKVSQNKSTV